MERGFIRPRKKVREAPRSQPCLRLASVDPPLHPGKERGREGRSPPCGGDRPKPSRVAVGWGGDCWAPHRGPRKRPPLKAPGPTPQAAWTVSAGCPPPWIP